MARVSPNIRQAFVDLSNENFCGDYGATLAFLYQQAIEYQAVKSIILNEDNLKSLALLKQEQNLPEETGGIRFLNGKVKNRQLKGGNNNE